MVAHAFNPSTWDAEAGGFIEFETSLVYRVSSRTARATQRNPVSKNQKEKKKTDKMSVICLGYPGTCATKPGWFELSMRKVQGIQ